MSTAVAVGGRPLSTAVPARPRWGRVEWYIAVLLLGSGLLFLPGAEIVRAPIRGLPYALSLGFLAWHLSAKSRRVMPAAAKLVLPAMFLYTANLAHPLTSPVVGVATVVFHLSVVAPLFWVGSLVRGPGHLEKLLRLTFAAAGMHVVMGILQAINPFVFMPPQISANPDVLLQQTYMGPFGQMIVRPPGLTDIPGGAATGGAMAAILGMAYFLRPGERPWLRMAGAAGLVGGFFVLYLTQVRAFGVMTFLALLVFVAIAFLQGRGRMLLMAGFGVVTLAALAGMEGFGYDPTDPYAPGTRYQEILDQGIFDAWMQNRGRFFQQTMSEHIFRYPLGAGLGRWGMMREYFGSGTPFSAVWVEIQLTGWLLDGGLLMWLLYGGAVVAAMLYSVKIALNRDMGEMAYLAAMILAIQCIIAGSTMAGPVYNTVFGILFWVLTAALYGAVAVAERKPPTRIIPWLQGSAR